MLRWVAGGAPGTGGVRGEGAGGDGAGGAPDGNTGVGAPVVGGRVDDGPEAVDPVGDVGVDRAVEGATGAAGAAEPVTDCGPSSSASSNVTAASATATTPNARTGPLDTIGEEYVCSLPDPGISARTADDRVITRRKQAQPAITARNPRR